MNLPFGQHRASDTNIDKTQVSSKAGNPARLNRNILLFYISKFFELPTFWLPFLYIYLSQYKGLPDTQVFFLLGLQEFLLIFLEVPTGVVADKISRKFSVTVGIIITYLPFVFLPFVNGFLPIFWLIVAKAVGRALISGADSSLLYDTLLDYKQEHRYKEIFTRGRSYTFAFTAICIFVSGFLSKVNLDLVFILPFPFAIISAIAMFSIQEPEISKKSKAEQDTNYFKHALKSFVVIKNSPQLFIPIAIFIIVDSIAVQMKYIYTPILSSLKVDLLFVGAITTAVYVLKSVMGYLNSKLMFKNENVNLIVGSMVSACSFVLMAVFLNPIVVTTLLCSEIFAEGLSLASITHVIQGKLSSATRATTMSAINLMSSLNASVFLWVFGFITEAYQMRAGVFFIGAVYLVMFALSTKLKYKDRVKD